MCDPPSTDLRETSDYPVISPSDYESDAEFGDIYRYIDSEQLTCNARKDKPILIMADRYVIEHGLLYIVDTPRQKRLARIKPFIKRLCVPLRYRHDIIKYVHNNCGHYAAVTLHQALSARHFWKSLYKDLYDFCRTCQKYQITKIDLSHRCAPMHPIPVPSRIGHFALDHKVLTRTTSAGNVAVVCIVEKFSCFPHFICVPDLGAQTTARALVDHVIPFWGIPESLQMDKSSSFTAALFKHVAAMLGVSHITTAARCSRSNG